MILNWAALIAVLGHMWLVGHGLDMPGTVVEAIFLKPWFY